MNSAEIERELKGFSEYLSQFQLSGSSTELYIIEVGKFLKLNDKITQETVNKFLKEHPRSYVKSALKYYLRFKNLHREIELPRIREPERKPRQTPRRVELERLFDKVKHRDTYWVLKLLSLTGARIEEILNIKLNDIDFSKNEITLRIKRAGGKGYRVVKLPSETTKELRHYIVDVKGLLGNERIFFTTSNNTHAAYVLLRKHLYKLKGGRALLQTHNFRRAIINEILDRTGGNVKMAQVFIGHKSILSTERYVAEWAEQKLKEEANRLLGLE